MRSNEVHRHSTRPRGAGRAPLVQLVPVMIPMCLCFRDCEATPMHRLRNECVQIPMHLSSSEHGPIRTLRLIIDSVASRTLPSRSEHVQDLTHPLLSPPAYPSTTIISARHLRSIKLHRDRMDRTDPGRCLRGIDLWR